VNLKVSENIKENWTSIFRSKMRVWQSKSNVEVFFMGLLLIEINGDDVVVDDGWYFWFFLEKSMKMMMILMNVMLKMMKNSEEEDEERGN